MKAAALAILMAGLLGACVAPPPPPPKPVLPFRADAAPRILAPPGLRELRNPGFESDTPANARCPVGWHCSAHSTPKSFRFFVDEGGSEGKRSMCIEPVGKEPWALVTQASYDTGLRGSRMRFSIAVRLTDVSGPGAGPWVQVLVPGRGKPTYQDLDQGSGGWQRRSVEFDVPGDASLVEFGVTMNGKGRACFDDARLEVLQPAKNPV
jgi:hypothetical protein